MEANFFYCLAEELRFKLINCRIGKVFHPAREVWNIEIQTNTGKHFLLLKTTKKNRLLFLTKEKPANPAHPSAHAMWLRKHISGQSITAVKADRAGRTLALGFFSKKNQDMQWLVLGFEQRPLLQENLAESFQQKPHWPSLKSILENQGIWRTHPHITPPLRKILAITPPERAELFLQALARGGCGEFFVYNAQSQEKGKSHTSGQIYAWRLPEVLRENMKERIFFSALDAAGAVGLEELFPWLEAQNTSYEEKAFSLYKRKLEKSLVALAKERERLKELTTCLEKGRALQSALWQVDKNAKKKSITLADSQGEYSIALNPRLTVGENMEFFFKKAAKGRRGLQFLEQREKKLQHDLEKACREDILPDISMQKNKDKKTVKQTNPLPAQGSVARFYTDDGFLVLRGKSAAGNEQVRRMASPFDLWFHARGGPGSHVVLRKNFPGQEVSEKSLSQAAVLAAVRSYAATKAKVQVMCALVRHVHPVQGGTKGSVTVSQEFCSLTVTPDPELEKRLAKKI